MGAANRALEMTMDVNPGNLPIQVECAGIRHDKDLSIEPPPGAFRDLVDEVCLRTYQPSPTIAMWAILSFVSGVAGRAYMLDNREGINNFMACSSPTGTGKTQNWNALMDVVNICAPELRDRVTNETINTGASLAKLAQNRPSMLLRVTNSPSWLKEVTSGRKFQQSKLQDAIRKIYYAAEFTGSWDTRNLTTERNNKSMASIPQFNMSIALDTTPQNIPLAAFNEKKFQFWIIVHGPKSTSDIPMHEPKATTTFQKT